MPSQEKVMDSKKVTNFLLLVIATCLVLIVAQLYDNFSLVAEAQAQTESGIIKGCHYDGGPCRPTAIQVDRNGVVLTRAVP
jgi:hypothetical protein